MLVLAMGCASSMSNGLEVGDNDREPNFPSLLIQNTGIDVLRVYENGRRIASVYPGQQECVLLRNAAAGIAELTFGVLAGGNDRWAAQQQHFDRNDGWAWVIDGSRPEQSEIQIFPTERCD